VYTVSHAFFVDDHSAVSRTRCGPRGRASSTLQAHPGYTGHRTATALRDCRVRRGIAWGCKRVDDEPTVVAGAVIALVRVWLCRDSTVDTDGVRDSLVFPHVCASPASVPGGASQKAQPASVCCITHPPCRRFGPPSNLDGRRQAECSSQRQSHLARGRTPACQGPALPHCYR